MATPVYPLRNLVDQLVKAREDRTSLEAKCDHLEGTLARAENRIAQLSPLNGDEGHRDSRSIKESSRKSDQRKHETERGTGTLYTEKRWTELGSGKQRPSRDHRDFER